MAQLAAFSPKEIGHRVLPVRAAGLRRVPVAARQVGGRRVRPPGVAAHRREARAQLQHQARVDDVLRRRAPVHPGAVLAAALHQHPDERHQRMLRLGDAGAHASRS